MRHELWHSLLDKIEKDFAALNDYFQRGIANPSVQADYAKSMAAMFDKDDDAIIDHEGIKHKGKEAIEKFWREIMQSSPRRSFNLEIKTIQTESITGDAKYDYSATITFEFFGSPVNECKMARKHTKECDWR